MVTRDLILGVRISRSAWQFAFARLKNEIVAFKVVQRVNGQTIVG